LKKFNILDYIKEVEKLEKLFSDCEEYTKLIAKQYSEITYSNQYSFWHLLETSVTILWKNLNQMKL